jgi:DNA-binding response OmpR family regulator
MSVAVLDIGLPGIDGFEVVRRLRARGSQLPVLLLTARDDVQDRVRGLEMGADDYLVKPFAAPELVARLPPRSRTQILRTIRPWALSLSQRTRLRQEVLAMQ